jgi:hypothetical protein
MTDDMDEVWEGLSSERLSSFRSTTRSYAERERILSCYLWNLALGESLYPSLQLLEVALRNLLHSLLTAYLGRADWYATPGFLGPDDLEKVEIVRRALLRDNKPETPGRIVAGLSFGFWSRLFNVYYEQGPPTSRLGHRQRPKSRRPIWPHLLSKFPAPMRTRRAALAARLYQIRILAQSHLPP